MAKPIVYGTIVSPPVRCVLLTASAIGLDIDFKDVDLMKLENLSEEYLKRNPQHTVPTLEDGGKFIWDSHAISTYLIGKYGKDDSLYPRDLYLRARIDQRLHFDTGVLFPLLKESFVQLFLLNHAHIDEKTLAKVFEGYDFLEKFLTRDQFLVGDSLTVADLSCISSVTSLNALYPIDSAKYPKTKQWIERISKLPYYATANQTGLNAFIKFIGSKANFTTK